jgi:hypothetical protein
VDRVHVSVDRLGVLGPPWTDVGADRGHGGTLTGAWPLGALVRQSSSAGAQNGEGSEGTRLGSHRSLGGAEEAGRRWCRTGRRRRSVRGLLRRGERSIGAGRGAVKLGEGARLLLGSGERRGGVAGAVNADVNGFNTIEDCRLDERLRRGTKRGEMKARW